MDLREYYNFPEGAKVGLKFIPSWLIDKPNFPLPEDCSDFFWAYPTDYLPPLDTSNVTNMTYMFRDSSITDSLCIAGWDTSNVTNMSYMFDGCSGLTFLDLSNWDTSKVTSMNQMLYGCSSLATLGAIDCSGISSKNAYPIYGYSNLSSFVYVGGFLGMKMSWDSGNGLYLCPNLTRESCINVLNGLFDFTGNGMTPSSSEGKLKVHQNFLTAVGDDIAIGVGKGWVITA